MQQDCNLVMYNDKDKPTWHTNTHRSGNHEATLTLTNEGKLVLNQNQQMIWNSDMDHGRK